MRKGFPYAYRAKIGTVPGYTILTDKELDLISHGQTFKFVEVDKIHRKPIDAIFHRFAHDGRAIISLL